MDCSAHPQDVLQRRQWLDGCTLYEIRQDKEWPHWPEGAQPFSYSIKRVLLFLSYIFVPQIKGKTRGCLRWFGHVLSRPPYAPVCSYHVK